MVISSDEKGTLIISISDGEVIKGFSTRNQDKKIYLKNHLFSKKKPSSLNISLKSKSTGLFVGNNLQKSVSLVINLILNFKELHILETGKKFKFCIIPRYKVESFCKSKTKLFFVSYSNLFIVDLFNGEFLKKVFLGEGHLQYNSAALTLSENGRYLFIQRNFILVLDIQKDYLLKKVSVTSQKFLFSKLFSRNQFLYSFNDGFIKLVNFNKNKILNVFKFKLSNPALFSLKIKPIDGNVSTVILLTFGTTIQFTIISSKKKLEIREPFSLNFKKKIESLGFLRTKRNLIIMFSGKQLFLPLKINFQKKKTRVIVSPEIVRKTQNFFRKKEFKTPRKKKKNSNHLKSLLLRLLSNYQKTDYLSDRKIYINYKIGNWKKKIIKNLDNTSSWWFKNIPIFKSFNFMIENLHFFQRKSILKIFYRLDYMWIKPFLNFVLKNLSRSEFSKSNLLIWIKEIFFHHFLLMSDTEFLSRITKDLKKYQKKYISDRNFLDISVFLTMVVIQSENFANRLNQPCVEIFI